MDTKVLKLCMNHPDEELEVFDFEEEEYAGDLAALTDKQIEELY